MTCKIPVQSYSSLSVSLYAGVINFKCRIFANPVYNYTHIFDIEHVFHITALSLPVCELISMFCSLTNLVNLFDFINTNFRLLRYYYVFVTIRRASSANKDRCSQVVCVCVCLCVSISSTWPLE